jgi:hypothetical protein
MICPSLGFHQTSDSEKTKFIASLSLQIGLAIAHMIILCPKCISIFHNFLASACKLPAKPAMSKL